MAFILIILSNLIFYTINTDAALFEKGFIEDHFILDNSLQHASKTVSFAKSMYKDSQIMFRISCVALNLKKDQDKSDVKFTLNFEMYYDKCHNKQTNGSDDESFVALQDRVEVTLNCTKHVLVPEEFLNKLVIFAGNTIDKEMEAPKTHSEEAGKDKSQEHPSTEHPPVTTKLDNKTIKKPQTTKTTLKKTNKQKTNPPTTAKKTTQTKPTETNQKSRKRRDAKEAPASTAKTTTTKPKKLPHNALVGENMLPRTMQTGFYQLTLNLRQAANSIEAHMEFNVYIESKGKSSFLSAMNWPLLPFFGFMSLLYLAYAIGWFIASCCNYKDLLRVQFWIGGVIGIGMLENALFYAEYQSISHTGKENGLLYVAELTSCAKRALARILVVIVSKGFGIVKPRLGQTLHKVLAVGTLYFILASIEGCIRVHDGGPMRTKLQTYAMIPVTVIDVALCWWVFTSLVQTTRTLRIRKNVVKLTLYRHFTNALIFTVIASLAYMVWTIKEIKFTHCIDISSLWLQDALWPFLFALILAVVMVLWRPSINNQRYAFTPLDLGGSDDEDDDMTFSEAFDGMKMRTKTESTANGSVNKNRNKAEDDLKWVEENIPSVPSTLLPTIDSDEEILTTKFEISKMD